MTDQWWCGLNQDGCSWTGPFDTKAEAVEEILADLEPDKVGYVGHDGPLPFGRPLLCARQILERLSEDVCCELDSEHPEYDSWLVVTKAQEDELGVALNATLKAWMEKHGYSLPTVICDVEEVRKT